MLEKLQYMCRESEIGGRMRNRDRNTSVEWYDIKGFMALSQVKS